MSGPDQDVEKVGRTWTRDRAEDLPILTHTRVLGVDVAVPQRDTMSSEFSGHREREEAVRFQTMGENPTTDPRVRRDLAAWARRNLFNGAGPA